MNNVVSRLMKDAGFCCIYSWVRDGLRREQYIEEIANHLGISIRTVVWHRKQYRTGKTKPCPKCSE